MQVNKRSMRWAVGQFLIVTGSFCMISGWAAASPRPLAAAASSADVVLTALRHDCKLLAGMQHMVVTSRDQYHWFQAEVERQGQAAAATASLWDYFAGQKEPVSRWHKRLRQAFEVELRRLPFDLAIALQAEAEKLNPEGSFYTATNEGLSGILLDPTQYLQPEAYSFLVAADELSAGLHSDCLAKMNALLP